MRILFIFVFLALSILNWHSELPAHSEQPSASDIRFVTPALQPPEPGKRLGGGSRCPCAPDLAALIPENTLGLTLSARPTFFFYIPQTSARTVEFYISDEKDNQVYQETFSYNGTPGIITLPISAIAPPLEIEKNYHWYFSIVCNLEDRSHDELVGGWIRRVELGRTLVNQLEKAAPRSRVALYAKAGIWHETLTTLAQLRQSQPNDPRLAAEWTELLNSVGLGQISQNPFVNCCRPAK